jgi:predicted nucleotidyltransferase
MTLEELRAKHKEAILEIATKYGASNVRVFGSVARGEADEASDVDLLVDLEKGRSLFDLGGLWYDLNEAIPCEIDVWEPGSLKERIRVRALREAVLL